MVMAFGQRNVDGGQRISLSILLLVVLTMLSASVILAESSELHMSVSSGGDAETVIQSGVSTVYAVLRYEDISSTELKIRISVSGGTVVFEHSDVYSDSGEESIEITGREVLAGYISAAQAQTEDLVEAVSIAQEAQAGYIKRNRVSTAVNVVYSLQQVLSTLEGYDLSLTTLDELGDAEEKAANIEDKAIAIMNGEVPDDELDAALEELAQLVAETADIVDGAVENIDTDIERPWLDGEYLTQLRTKVGPNEVTKDSVEWKISPDGVAGTQVPPSATSTVEPTMTPTSTQTPTSTATAVSATAIPSPTSLSTEPATPTPTFELPDAQTPTPTVIQSLSQNTTTPGPTALPPTETPAANEPLPTMEGEAPAQSISTPAERQASASETSESDTAETAATPMARALLPNEKVQSTETGSGQSAAAAVRLPNEMPLAPQEVSQLPIIRIAAVVSALTLGIVALWLRAKV